MNKMDAVPDSRKQKKRPWTVPTHKKSRTKIHKMDLLFVGFSLKMFLFNILILKNKRKIMSNTTRYHPYSPLISSGSQSTSHRQQSSTSSPLPSQTPNTPTNIQATQSQQTETTDSTRHILRVNVGQLFMKKVENALISWNIPREDFVGDLNEY